MKKIFIFRLLMMSQNIFAYNLELAKFQRTVAVEVAAGAGATFMCGASLAIALKNKGGINAGTYIGCSALYTALRQAVNAYQIDKEIEEEERRSDIAELPTELQIEMATRK